MTHKVAILMTTDIYDYDDDYRHIVNSITEWEVISHTDFVVLQQASYRKGFKIIEQPIDIKDFVAKTVSEEIARAKEEQLKLEAEKIKRAELAQAKKFKKELKDKESKIALLKKLQAELGNEVT